MDIRDFFLSLPSGDMLEIFKVRINKTVDKRYNRTLVELIIDQQDLIDNVVIPFFSPLKWRSKKLLDFQDFVLVSKLKQQGHHYSEKGKELINLIRGQMNNNRLSTKLSSSGDQSTTSPISRQDLYRMADNILSDSNYELGDGGVIRIKSSGKTLISGKSKKVEIQCTQGNVIHKFNSFNSCAKFLGISTPTAIKRAREGKTFLLSDQLVLIKELFK